MRGRNPFGRLMPHRFRTTPRNRATKRDHRALPAYTVSEAAHYLNVPATTLRSIAISPGICAGRPVIVGTGLSTQIIAERYKAGESVHDLAKDYERDDFEIEEAIRCELDAAA